MNPFKYAQMMKYLTRAKKANPELPDVFPASKASIPKVKDSVATKDAINRFVRANPRTEKAGGGMLVQPGFGGTRQGYAGDKSLKPGQKKSTSIGKEPGIFKISTRASDKIKYNINYTDNEGNRKKFTSTESFRNITEAKKARDKKIRSLEKELNIPEGKLLDETYTTRRKNIRLLPKNKKNYITLTELRNLLGPGSEDMRAVGGSKDTVVAKAAAKLLDQTKITTKDGANYFFYKKPTDKQLNLLKTYIDARPIRKDMFERIQNLQKDKYTAKIVKDGKLPMNADGVLDEKFLKHVSDNYGTLDKYVHGLVRYTQALDGQTIIGLNDLILSDGKFKTNKKLANSIVNTFLETPSGSSNATQNTIRKAIYKAAMNDITNELGNTETTFENFKNQIRQKINNDFKLKGKGIEIDELIGVSTSFRNKTAPYAVFTQFVSEELNQGILKDYQKVVSNYTAQLKDEINKNSKFVNGKWQHSKKAKDIVNNFNTNIIPNLKNVDQLKGTNVSLPELTLGSPTDKTLGGTKGRLNQLENMGLNFREFYRQEGFGYKMPEGVVTQKEILGDKKTQANLLKKMGFKCKFAASKGGLGRCDDPNSYTDDINKTRQDLKSDDVRVRAAAQAKLNKGLQVAKTLPTINKFLRRAGQATVGAVSSTLKTLGLTTPVGYAIEGIVEGGIYDYFKKQGYTDQQALAETFTPGLISGRPEGVPWYGGAEPLLEKELVGDEPGRQFQPKVAQYVDALKDQEQVFDAFGRLEQGEQAQRKDIIDAARADIRDLNKSGTISNINRIMNPESMASQAYQTAVERQAGAQDQRARDYMAENYVQTDPTDFAEQQLQKKRNEEMLKMFPTPTVEDVQNVYKQYGVEDLLKNFTAQDYKAVMGGLDDLQKQSYFADNFRLEKAGGGIAKLAGVDSGPPPESGPMSQGLQGLMKRVRNL